MMRALTMLRHLLPRSSAALAFLGIAALTSVSVPAHALEDAARQRVIDEACPGFEREEKGANGVMSPREVRCRLAMGQSYEEIDADIKERQQRQVLQQRRDEDRTRLARERATQGREAAQREAPELCRAMVEKYRTGRWFTSSSTAVSLLRDETVEGRRIETTALAGVAQVMDRLGHNYSEPDQRTLVLKATTPEAFQQFSVFNQQLDTIGANIRTRASRAQFYEQTGRTASGPVQAPPSATDYAFACFLQQQFGSIQADPFDRAMRLDASGHYLGAR